MFLTIQSHYFAKLTTVPLEPKNATSSQSLFKPRDLNINLTSLVFSIRNLNHGTLCFPLGYITQALKKLGRENLQHGPRTRLESYVIWYSPISAESVWSDLNLYLNLKSIAWKMQQGLMQFQVRALTYLPCIVVGTVIGDIKEISGCPNKLGKYCKWKQSTVKLFLDGDK